MNYAAEFGRRLLLKWDAAGYGGLDEPRQAELQNQLLDRVNWAAKRADLHPEHWERQAGGDGELAVLGNEESEPRLVDDFVGNLVWALSELNRPLRPTERFQVRVAIHHGVAMKAPLGFSGRGVVIVSRLVDCEALKKALRVSSADLGLIVSEQVFNDTIAQRHTKLSPAAFREVEVQKKEFRGRAWIYLPDHDIHAIDLSDAVDGAGATMDRGGTAAEPHAAPGAKKPDISAIVNNFHAPVEAPYGTFGIRYGRDD